MADRICTVPDCDTVGQTRRDMCNMHYKRWRTHGDPLLGGNIRHFCTIDGCDSPVVGRGWCQKHYDRWAKHGDPTVTLRIVGDDLTRFWSYVDRDGPVAPFVEHLGNCWLWTGLTDDKGYGHARVEGRNIGAHVWAWRLLVGPVPNGLELDHLCRVTGCVRVTHLEPVAKAENVRRRNLALAGKPWLVGQVIA